MHVDKTTWRSPNHRSRGGAMIATVVVHSCEGALPSPRKTSLPWLCNPASRVSSHYYVCRDGTIFQLVDDSEEAWHAGGKQDNGIWTAKPAFSNGLSIGIECEHRTGQDWPAVQKNALAWLLRKLVADHNLPIASIDTHGQIALPGPYKRKVDPSDWSRPIFLLWRNEVLAPPPPLVLPAKRYRVRGLPVYESSTRTGPQWGTLKQDDVIEIDDPSNGHIASLNGKPAGIGFIRFDPDTLEPVS